MIVEQGTFGQAGVVLVTALLLACDPAVSGDSATEGGGTSAATTDSVTEALPTTTDGGGSTDGATGDASTTDDGPEPPPAYDEWLVVRLPGAVCGNGSEYKIFVNYHEGAKDLLIMLEPGGACWDYETCAGKVPLGAAHPNGVPDDLMFDPVTHNLSPLIRRDLPGPTQNWNLVFMPYCTGDVHTGNNVITYKDPNGVEPDLEFHHNGHNNVVTATKWMADQFREVARLFVTGCSAGGAGSIINYHFFREGIPAKRGYMMNDSGPIFTSLGPSGPLHTKIRTSWNVDSVLGLLPPGYEITDDFGILNEHLSDLYPEDRLSTVFFQRDYNYSRYSYERFYPDMTKDKILAFWTEDTDVLQKQYDPLGNMAYYLPYWRGLNDSHCVSIISYLDTEIEEKGVDLGNFIDDLLDDGKPLVSYRESVQPNEDN